MSLAPRTRLGPYEIVGLVGSGGMGEVYQARDTRLDRRVALKVIAGGRAVDQELRMRFEREARTISSLSHPHICVLHDIGRERPLAPVGDASPDGPSGGEAMALEFLVMEYLEGETLAARLARRPAHAAPMPTPPMTMDDALAAAIQIASALDGAHRAGFVHRDLKPANIMLTAAAKAGAPGGAAASRLHVKLMDFGLARLVSGDSDGASGPRDRLAGLSEASLPTTSAPLTRQGAILGTMHYMAPEQLEGKPVDARTDLFAFGVVLYEMLTGQRPFAGDSPASVIAAILGHEPPPVTSLLPQTPPLLAELLARCLAKDAGARWQSARDLMRQLELIATGNGTSAIPVATSVTGPASPRTRLLSTIAALLTTASIAGGAVAWTLWPTPVPVPVVTRFAFDLPDGQRFTRGGRRVVAVSPDGTKLVYVANAQLYLRHLHELTAVAISGTEDSNPAEPVFSPDGQWVAFFSNGALKKVPVTGGSPVHLSAAESPLGASWDGDRLLLGQLNPRGIVEIPANGGAARTLVALDERAGEQAWGPQIVAGGKAVLFTLRTGAVEWDDSAIVVHDLSTEQRHVLLRGGADARVLPTGHLVYAKATSLFAVPFDQTRLMVTGGPVPVHERLARVPGSGSGQTAWSANGTLVSARDVPGYVSTLHWVTRQGQLERSPLPPRNYGVRESELRVSPDGTRVAVSIYSDATLLLPNSTEASEVYVGDTERGTVIRLSSTGRATSPVWSPDGQRVCYDSGAEVFCQAADGSGGPGASFKVDGLTDTRAFSRDGTRMVLETQGPTTGNDISIATLGPPVETRPLLNSTYAETAPAISPDGRWLAYVSDESGRPDVYVRPFPDVERGRWPISTGGGSEPRWARNGRELFFTVRGGWTLPGTLMAVAVHAGASFSAGQPTPVWKIPAEASLAYDVAPDGRFLFHIQSPAAIAEEASHPAPRPSIVVVQNWFEELKARVPSPSTK
jgi:eukaryotic-like serine/threonine-protein kinase